MSEAKSNGSDRHAHALRPRVSIIGGGAWGVALASAAAHAGSDVLLYARREVRVERVGVTKSLRDVAKHATLLVLAVPSDSLRGVARTLGDEIDGHHAIVHGIRGLVVDASDRALVTISEVLREETPVRRIGALGGPVLTSELAAGKPSVLVVGSRYPDVLHAVRAAFGAPSLRIYPTEDLVGLEWASALTAILAVAVGFARGRGLGAGIIAAAVTRGVHEAARIAVAAGAEERTFLGLGGFGDLLAAIADEARPEVRLGEAIARGESIAAAVEALGQRIEAVELAPRIAAFASKHRVAAPIFDAIAHGLIAREKPFEELIASLMSVPITAGA